MNTFQSIVVPLTALIAMYELASWFRGGSRIGLIKAIVWACFAVTVLKPDLVQRLASIANIGRGADLLLYGLVVFVLLVTFRFVSELEIQRHQLTLLVRQLAKERPWMPQPANFVQENEVQTPPN
jgi:small membrane protein